MSTQEKVYAIEKFPFWTSTKVELLLVLAGLKHAITIDVRGKAVACLEPTPPPSLARIHAVENLLTRINLPFITLDSAHREWPENNQHHCVVVICVGNSRQDAKDMAKIWTSAQFNGFPIKELDAEHGRLSGFPRTAINAFTQDKSKLLSNDEVDKRTQDLEWAYFCQMRFTEAHWRDELLVVEQWAKAVQKLNPKLYNQVTK